jgi:hypothetical protein
VIDNATIGTWVQARATPMRSAGGTTSGAPDVVTRSTKATMAFFGAVSFHDGIGSCATVGRTPARVSATSVVRVMNLVGCMVVAPFQLTAVVPCLLAPHFLLD